MNGYQEFQEIVWEYYRLHGRDLPWRPPSLKLREDQSLDPYAILVSEVMLQQTQARRVIPKYYEFLALFPDLRTLVQAPLSQVIRAWSGLGYNRRAKYLHEAAKQLIHVQEPWTLDDLTQCPGIGYNTAAAVLTYAYNLPVPFIETNVRTVYIHHFFADKQDISDKELMPIVTASLDQKHPREFMWAVMDYGHFIKSTQGNIARLSKHYVKQPRFKGSKRQIRGQVLRLLHEAPVELGTIQATISDERLLVVLEELIRDGLIEIRNSTYQLAS